jgi:hypothetical protein
MARPRKHTGPRKGRKAGGLREAAVLVPLTYNDGSRVPRSTLASVQEELFREFGGWTVEGTVKGAYRMRETGKKRVERSLKISVVLDGSQVPDLEAMVARWCAELGQEVMLLKITESIIKFVPPRPEEQP